MTEDVMKDVVKEYLAYMELESTLECFEAEMKSKALIKSLVQKTSAENSAGQPRLYHLCINTSQKDSRQRHLDQSIDSYNSLLKSSKSIFKIAVNLISLLEDARVHMETVSAYKLQLSKLQHDVGISSITSEESLILNPSYIQSMRNSVLAQINAKNHELLTQTLVKVRVECLSAPQHQRLQLIMGLEANDILGGKLNLLLMFKDTSVISATLALVSILTSADSGRRYVLGNNAVYVCKLIIDLLKSQKAGSVCQRFALACLVKLSHNDSAANSMINSQLAEHLSTKILKKTTNEFIKSFSAALLVNILSIPAGKSYIAQNRPTFLKILQSLIKDCKIFEEIEVIFYCLLACKSILEVFPDVSVASDIAAVVERVRRMEGKSEEELARLFEVCNEIINKHFIKIKIKEEEEIIYFECFADESAMV